jgi:FtsH-binding integral membrane protein
MRSYSDYPLPLHAADDGGLVSHVLSLLGFAFLFTTAGAVVGLGLGPGSIPLSLLGGIATFIALLILRGRSPVNLILLYGFAAFEGMALAPVLDEYVAAGLGSAVVQAALSTAIVGVVAGGVGATTRRSLNGLAGALFAGLIAVVVASFAGLFIGSSAFATAVAAVSALVFTGLIVVDLNRVATSTDADEGDAVLLAVNIYLDVINLFTSLLRLFGSSERSS